MDDSLTGTPWHYGRLTELLTGYRLVTLNLGEPTSPLPVPCQIETVQRSTHLLDGYPRI